MAQYAAAIDQGTTSTRFMVFDHGGQVVSVDQKEHEQIYPKPGCVEHDANEIWQRTQEMVSTGVGKTQASDIAAVGVTNQRGTPVGWGGAPGCTTSRPSACRTSDRPGSSGTGRRGSRSTARSCGRTPAPTRSATSCPPTGARTGSGPSPRSRFPTSSPTP